MFLAPGQLIHSGRACVETASSGTMIDGSLETSLPLASSGVSVILCHLAGMPLGSEEVEALTSSMVGNCLELEPGVTPAISTWGGTTMVDDVEAGARDALEGMEVHAWKRWWPVRLPPTSWLLGYLVALLLTVALHPHATILPDFVYNLPDIFSVKPEKKQRKEMKRQDCHQ